MEHLELGEVGLAGLLGVVRGSREQLLQVREPLVRLRVHEWVGYVLDRISDRSVEAGRRPWVDERRQLTTVDCDGLQQVGRGLGGGVRPDRVIKRLGGGIQVAHQAILVRAPPPAVAVVVVVERRQEATEDERAQAPVGVGLVLRQNVVDDALVSLQKIRGRRSEAQRIGDDVLSHR